MAKKISSKDLFEQEDIFKGVRDSAEKTLVSLNKINDEFKQTAATLKQSLGDAKFDSSDSIKKFTQATAEANKIQKQAIEIEKLKEQVRQQAIKSEKEQERLQQERIKTQKAEAQEKARLAKESEKAAKAAESEASSYSKLSKNLNDLRKKYKDLAIQNQENTAEGQQLLKQITDLDTQLKKVDATVGQHQRNVGNYEGATKNLKTELRALTRELMNMSESDPRFQEMAQRAGELKDQISDTQAVVKATAGSAMENFAGSVAKVGQIGVAAFQGMESSMVLLGVENEAVLESMQKLQALAGLGDALQTLGGLGDALTEIRAGFTATLSKMGLLTAAKQADTVATVENTVATGVQTVATEVQTAATVEAEIATNTLNKTMLLNPYVAVAAAVAVLGTALYMLLEKTYGLTKEQKIRKQLLEEEKKTTEEVNKQVYAEAGGYINLMYQLKNTNAGSTQRIELINKINAQYGTTLKNLSDEALFQQQANAAIQDYITHLRNKFTLQANEKKMTAIFEDQNKEQEKAIKLQERINKQQERINRAKKSGNVGSAGIALLERDLGTYKQQLSSVNAVIAVQDERLNTLGQHNTILNEKTENKFIPTQQKQTQVYQGTSNAIDTVSEATQRLANENTRLANLQEQINAKSDEYLNTKLTDQQQEENAVREKYFYLITEGKKYGMDVKTLEEAQQFELTAIDQKYSDKRIAIEKARQNNILNQEEEFMNLYQEAINSDKQNEINGVREKYFNLIEMAKQKGLDTKILEEKLQKELSDIDAKYNKNTEEKTKKSAEDRQKIIEAFAQKTADYFKKKSDEKIAQIDKEIAAAEKQNETLKALAADGNINAQQSLAENQRIIDQANLKKEKQLKKQQRIEAGLAIFKLFSANADKKNPLAKTISDTTGLLAFISSLPMFYDGTEDTGTNGKGIDGKGGFHAVLHPNERVVPKSLNEQIGSMSNEQLAKLAQEYQNGRLIAKNNANSSLELAVLASKLDTLTDVIKNKPETNIALGEITQSAMQIVESKRTGNTTIYNRFRVSK